MQGEGVDVDKLTEMIPKGCRGWSHCKTHKEMMAHGLKPAAFHDLKSTSVSDLKKKRKKKKRKKKKKARGSCDIYILSVHSPTCDFSVSTAVTAQNAVDGSDDGLFLAFEDFGGRFDDSPPELRRLWSSVPDELHAI